MLHSDLKGDGPTIGPYFLMNEFFDLAGYEGNEFMKYSNDMRDVFDVIHVSGRYKNLGVLTTELSTDSQKKLNEFLQIQYYWKKAK